MAVQIVEVLAIYENPGVAVTGARQTQIDADMVLADNAADRYAPGGVVPGDDFVAALVPKYGAGFKLRRIVSVAATGVSLGQAIFARLNTRAMKPGSKVEVFPDDRDTGGTSTGVPVYRRRWPSQGDDIG